MLSLDARHKSTNQTVSFCALVTAYPLLELSSANFCCFRSYFDLTLTKTSRKNHRTCNNKLLSLIRHRLVHHRPRRNVQKMHLHRQDPAEGLRAVDLLQLADLIVDSRNGCYLEELQQQELVL